MSIILEALKKSENQRQRQSGPGFASTPERGAHGGRNLWPLLVVILLALNTAILAFFLLRGSAAPVTIRDNAGDQPGEVVPAVQPDTARRRPPAAAMTSPPRAAAVSRDVRPLEAEAGTTTGTHGSPAAPAGAPANAPAPSPPLASLPTAMELQLKGELTGPPLHLDLHVYYPDARRRVVFVNGGKYREGERLASGPLVKEIVPDGVILTNGARTFLLQAE